MFGDVRKYEVVERLQFTENVRAVSIDGYKLTDAQKDKIHAQLSLCSQLDPFDPVSLAWEPLFAVYLQQGADPAVVQRWLPLVLRRKLDAYTPNSHAISDVYSEWRKLGRSSQSERFEGITKQSVDIFLAAFIPFHDNRNAWYKEVYSETLISAMMADAVDTSQIPWGQNFAAALYLYHYQKVFEFHFPDTIRTKLQGCIKLYVNKFVKEFNDIIAFLGPSLTSGAYQWYAPEIRDIIVMNFESSLQDPDTREWYPPTFVYSLPPWLSEDLTKFLTMLPCNFAHDRPFTFIPDAILTFSQASLSYHSKDLNERASLILKIAAAVCVSRYDYNKFFHEVGELYWEVRAGTFVPMLCRVRKAQIEEDTSANPDTMERYIASLASRGFDISGIPKEGF